MIYNRCQVKTQRIELTSSHDKSNNISTAVKSNHKPDNKKTKTKPQKSEQERIFKKTSKNLMKASNIQLYKSQKLNRQPRLVLQTHETAYNSKKKDNIDRLISSSLKQYSTQKIKIQNEKKKLENSRKKQTLQLKKFEKSTRVSNRIKFPPGNPNAITERLPWGADEARIKRHVILTIQKIGKIKNRSASNSKSPNKRDRDAVGLGFLNRLSPEKVQQLVLKTQRSCRDLSSSCSSLRSSKCHGQLKTQQSIQRFKPHPLDIMQRFQREGSQGLFQSLKGSRNVGGIKKVIRR